MGIFCEINLLQPPDGSYYAGQSVTGLVKYAVDEPMECEGITISLKGSGYVALTVKRKDNKNQQYRKNEVYVDTDEVVQKGKELIPVGAYNVKFGFNISWNIPSTTNVFKYVGNKDLECKIKYYIRIKFERPGVFARNKHFRKEITIISRATAKLLREPVIYGETKKLMRLFSSKNNIINIKATIPNSVMPTDGKIEVQYEVENKSSTIVKNVKTQLVEVYKFYASGPVATEAETRIPHTKTKTLAVQCGETQIMAIEINIPSDIHTLDYSTIVSRDFFVRIEVTLPIPHINLVLNIPVQIGTIDEYTSEIRLEDRDEEMSYDDPPPSYWEAMDESKKEDYDEK